MSEQIVIFAAGFASVFLLGFWFATNEIERTVTDADGYVYRNLKYLGWDEPPQALATTTADNIAVSVSVFLGILCVLAVGSYVWDWAASKWRKPLSDEKSLEKGSPNDGKNFTYEKSMQRAREDGVKILDDLGDKSVGFIIVDGDNASQYQGNKTKSDVGFYSVRSGGIYKDNEHEAPKDGDNEGEEPKTDDRHSNNRRFAE